MLFVIFKSDTAINSKQQDKLNDKTKHTQQIPTQQWYKTTRQIAFGFRKHAANNV